MRIITKDFFTFLETASVGEMFAFRDKLYEARRKIRDQDYRREIQVAIRRVDEELVARAELAAFLRRQQA